MKDQRARLGEATGVDQARVVAGIRTDHITFACERSDYTQVGLVAGGEEQSRLCAEPLCDSAFEFYV